MIRDYLQQLEKDFWANRKSDLRPSIFQNDYLFYSSLSQKILLGFLKVRRKIKSKKLDIIDIGSGAKPYFSLFSPYARKYVGVDIDPRVADVVASGESLPLTDNSFDLAVSFQTLEHCQYPSQVVAEMKRVLRPKGFVILTTHGIWMHHPCPHDYYRWTNEGLHELFTGFAKVDVEPTLTSWSTLLQLLNVELYGLACRHVFLKLPLYMVIVVNNLIGKFVMPFGKKHLTIDYVVLARK
ncbi:MAG: class I SAM-dependent methyltransferase [Candidatus Levybacteria bacterium]|nr:class I SAM-dependent methyltransferase [Candidatus Levybacteria bacterium]